MPSITTRNARKAVKSYFDTARGKITAARESADDARASSNFTEEGKAEIAADWATSARKAAASALERAHVRAGEARRKGEKALESSRTVPESERSAASATLLPVITAAAQDPTVLVRAYERRAPNSLADRIILEESIQACIDAGLGDVGFLEEWNHTRGDLADAVQSDDERAALEDLAAVEGLETYIGAAAAILQGDVAGVEGGGAEFTVSYETARYTVATYEKALEAGTVDGDAPTVLQAEDVLETPETPAEPQHVPAAVAAETAARRAAVGIK